MREGLKKKVVVKVNTIGMLSFQTMAGKTTNVLLQCGS
jgi:hypothetical protein